MAKDEILDEPPKGHISSPFAQASKEGMQVRVNNQIVNTYAGTYGSDNISGSEGRDIFLPRGVSHGGQQGGRDSVIGGKGRDTVVLDGNQSDYLSVLPNIAVYPKKMAADFWKESPQMAYGRVVVLQNTKTGDTFTLRDVEEVAFADNKLKFIQPKRDSDQEDGMGMGVEAIKELDEAIASKKIVAVSTRELLALAESGATPQEKLISRLTSTPQAMDAFEKMRGVRDYDAASKKIAEDLMKGAGGAKLVEEIKAAPVSQTLVQNIPEQSVQQVARVVSPKMDMGFNA